MDPIETVILREPAASDHRLLELGVSRAPLIEVRDVALHDSSNATPFHAANAGGTFSYHGGTWALRDRFIGGDWVLDRLDGVEAIRNEKLKLRIAFSNVDLACNDDHMPKPRTKKGAGAERAMGGLFGTLPQFAPRQSGEWMFYYLMVDERGAAELTRPVVRGGTFVAAIERIYLSNGTDEADISIDDTSDAMEYDPQIERK